MTWRKRAHVVTSGECGPPVVQVMKRNTAPSSDGDRARQMPQARSCGEQGSDELYSQRLCAPGCAARLGRGWKKSKPVERLGVMRAHGRRNLQARKHAEGAQ
jgi:hypothetical protein